MPSISGNYNPQVGPLIQVAIMPPDTVNSLQQGEAPPRDLKMYMALIDTGASTTCLSQNVIEELRLEPIGKTRMSGATGANDVHQYNFCVGFMFNAAQEATGIISGSLGVHPVEGCKFENHGCVFDILLGRDIICKGALSVSFDGHFILSL